MTTTYPLFFQKILNDTVNMAYVDEGMGDRIILFIHGLGHSHLAWQQNIEHLKKYYRCIAIDLPGNGNSSIVDRYTLDFFANCIADFISIKKLKNVFIAGHSMGGQIAMTFALQYPSLYGGLILCAPAGFEVFNDWEKNLYRSTMYFLDMVSNEENSLRKAVQNSFYILPENAQPLIKELIKNIKAQNINAYRKMIEQCISSMLDEPVYDKLGDIIMPVLIIFGEKDSMIPNRFIHPITTYQLAKNASEKFSNATLEMIPQCGHFVQWEKPLKVNGLVRHFVSTVEV